ncbi:hypothetical protein [Nonomuraea sp. NPDC050310]|uniref:hypothetical protein n=1 Tax=Nonomuraea sp. NPDC050310 TaxID=3154935 RepID=UPI00340A7EC1
MPDLPAVRVLPDHVGELHELIVGDDGQPIAARVSWNEITAGWHGGMEPREGVLQLDQIAPMQGQDYSRVPRVPVSAPQVVAPPGDVPAGWPDGVAAPGTEGWEKAVMAWLFDLLPPDFRAHAVLSEHPLALVWMARLHLRHAYTATVQGYRTSAVQLKSQLPPHAVREVDEVYRQERDRIIRCGRALDAIEAALRPSAPE